MLLQLSNEESQMFNNLARSNDGLVLADFISRLISQIESIRTKTELSNEARIEVANVLEKNFIDRLKVLSTQYEAPNLSEHE